MKRIPLTQGKYALVDDDDFEELSKYKWSCSKDCNTYYARTSTSLRMHRVILGAKPGQQVDHINGNGLDNRRSNLRICTRPENARNCKNIGHNTSGFRGVSVDRNRMRAQIKVNGKRIHLGNFTNPEDAHAAYVKASKELHGEFSVYARPANG